MDLGPVFDQLVHTVGVLPRSGLLLAAVAAMVLGVLGSLLLPRVPALGRVLRIASTFALMAILLLVIVQLSRLDPRFSLAIPEIGLPEQVVEGGATRVPLAPDGHFWLQASINGHRANFMVDTGATLTAVSDTTALAAGLTPRDTGLPVRLQTANGTVAAQMTSIETLRFGNVAARGLDAVIAPGLGETNVIGMNLLSRLAEVRIEAGELVLVPHHPQAPPPVTD